MKLQRMKHAVENLTLDVASFAGLILGLALVVTSFLGAEWRMLVVPGAAFALAGLLYGMK
jgi:hypothetical protein